MARNEKIAIEIEAKDDASAVIKKLATKIDGLEADEARIIVTADTRKLQDQLDRAKLKLAMLDGDEATVQSRLVGTLEEDLEQARKLAEQLDGQTATVKIDSVGAKQNIDDLSKSADSSKSVLANMVGNTTQDLGALGGVAGTAGVAIGQMGEYMADAAGSGDKLSTILKNFAGVAAPIAAVGVGMKMFADRAKNAANIKAFRKEEVEDYNDALAETNTTLGAIKAKLQSGKGIFVNFFGSEQDVTGVFQALGLGADRVAKLIEGGKPAIDAWAAAMRAGGADTDGVAIAVAALTTNVEDLGKAQAAEALNAEFFGTTLTLVDDAIKKLIPSEEQLKKAHDDAAAAAKNNADKVRELTKGFDEAKSAADRLKTKNQELRDEISNDQFLLDLKDQWREVEIAGDEAMQAAVDKTLDAGIKLDDYIQKQNDAKLALLDYRDTIGTLPEESIIPIIAQIDEGSFAEAERRMTILMRNRTAQLRLDASGGNSFFRLEGVG